MTSLQQMQEHAPKAVSLLKELSNEKRLMICCAIGTKELSVSQLNELVPLSQSALSQHLARLRDASIVTTRKDGLVVYYKLASENAAKIIGTLREIYCPD